MDVNVRECYGSVIVYIREQFPDEIDEAYEFFWEEEFPEDFLSGSALELGFLNFEDWLICDYRPKGDAQGFIDRYIEHASPSPEHNDILRSMRDSFISLYEVIEPGVDGKVSRLKDLALDKEIAISDPKVSALKQGDVFGGRLIKSAGSGAIGLCVYPFGQVMKAKVIEAVEAQYKRYQKKNPDGGMERFLKDESYIFNMIWLSYLYRQQ